MSPRSGLRRSVRDREKFEDEARFLRSWFERPLVTGAVAPSGKALAKTMAAAMDARSVGPIVELGPGTGPVTEALLARGIEQERLVLVEFNPGFCDLLAKRFPGVKVVQGDAYDVASSLADVLAEPSAGVLSSLPLFTKPLEHRLSLLEGCFRLMAPGAPFVQFTYSVVPPIPARSRHYTATASERIWRNVPPARVWVYRRV
jgi:phosphatidylethanolamine/phosphatidyl-N-methylethanolamine N-methyltransferase